MSQTAGIALVVTVALGAHLAIFLWLRAKIRGANPPGPDDKRP